MKIFVSSSLVGRAVPCPPQVSCNSVPGAQGTARPAYSRRERGIALVVTLILLTVITFLAVAFLYLSQRERSSVTTAVDLSVARLAAEAGTERAKAELLSKVMVTRNAANYGLQISTNYINPIGFQPNNTEFTNVNYNYANGNSITPNGNDLQRNIANLYYNPRPPVFVDTNAPGVPPAQRGPLDFRYWLDLNRNGIFDDSGQIPVISPNGNYYDTNGNEVGFTFPPPQNIVSNYFVGDPQWIGIPERTDRAHGPNNRFTQRFAYIVVPEGKALDVNTIHNQSKRIGIAQDGFLRNMGVSPFEMNLAAFLVDLNTNIWNPNGALYIYNTNGLQISTGVAFEDARNLTRYRYDWDYNNLRSVNTLFGGVGAAAFLNDFADGYAAGPLMGDRFLPQVDPDAPNRVNTSWSGDDSINRFFTTQDLFDRNKTAPPGTPAATLTFSDRLRNAGSYSPSSYDRYTYYRLLSQLGTDSGPEPLKMDLNYKNIDQNRVIPNAQTNFVNWGALDFFTNAVNRLLLSHGRLDALTNGLVKIPVYTNNTFVYGSSLNRILQLAANIYESSFDSSSNGLQYPTIYRPIFSREGQDIFITDFALMTESWPQLSARPIWNVENSVGAASVQPNDLIYGVPLIVGARKGLPNFNRFTMQSVSEISRKLQLYRPSVAAGVLPTATNQAYFVTISNVVASQAWNSYAERGFTNINIYAINSSFVSFRYTNDPIYDLRGGSVNFAVNMTGVTNIPIWASRGYDDTAANPTSFQIPFYTNLMIQTQAVFRSNLGPTPFFNTNLNFTGVSNNTGILKFGFEQTGEFPMPKYELVVTNLLRFVITDSNNRILDYVQLNKLNQQSDLTEDMRRGAAVSTNATERLMWDNRRASPQITSSPQGIKNQILASLGQGPPVDWKDVPGVRNKELAIDGFRSFWGGLTPLTYPNITANTNLYMEAPYTPVWRNFQLLSWEANDPLVHYTASDLANLSGNDVMERTAQDVGLRNFNKRYEPWGGRPSSGTLGRAGDAGGSVSGVAEYSVAAKDPGVRSADWWDFPTNKYPSVGWLGRVHRGTPWQTVYMKSGDIGGTQWTKWTGNAQALDAGLTKPVLDARIFETFTAAFDENATRGQINVNQDGLAAWSAALSGIVGLTNVSTQAQLNNKPPILVTEPYVINPAGVETFNTGIAVTNTVVGTIWAGINRTRSAGPFNGSFGHLGDILATPELSVNSPLLNLGTSGATSLEQKGGIDDPTYERLPQMLMGLLRGSDQPRFAIYSYGQTLKPANRSIVTSGQLSGMCTNYQVTAEFATRTVVRVEGAPINPRVVVESFNILPPDE